MAKPKRNEELVEKIYASLELNADGKVETSVDTYTENLPIVGDAQITPEQADAVHDYDTVYVASSVEALGKKAVDIMTEDKKPSDVTGAVSMRGFGEVIVKTNRERAMTVAGKDTVVKGGTSVDVAFIAGKNAGLLANAKQRIKEIANEKL